jgi:hypothetical protein
MDSYDYMGISIVIGVPQNTKIDGLFHGKFSYKWMRTGGTPMDWKPPYPKCVEF